jgi:heptaprenyl diphosphate synthase
MKAKKVATYGLLVALAFILSYIENLFPLSLAIPGIKLGLANLVVVTALYSMGAKEAFVLSLLRILLVSFTFGNLSMMLYSLAGGMLSWLLMTIFKKTKLVSMTGVSIIGGIAHNIGQIGVAILVVETFDIAYYLPFLMIVGVITGAVIGILGAMINKRVKFT